MSVVLLGSAKGSPGVTTLALLLARSWPPGAGSPVVVEADPSGGDLAGRLGLPGHPDLTNLAADARHDPLGVGVEPYLQQIPTVDGQDGGLGVLTGVGSAVQGRALEPLWPTIAASLGRLERPVLVDLGRVAPDDTHLASLAPGASLLLLVLRPEVAGVARAVDLGATLAARRLALALVLVGDDPYDAGEVAGATGIPVLGVVPDDPQSARALLAGRGWGPGIRRFRRALGQLSLALALAGSDNTGEDGRRSTGRDPLSPGPVPDGPAGREPPGRVVGGVGVGPQRTGGNPLETNNPTSARSGDASPPSLDIEHRANSARAEAREVDMGARR